MFNVYSEFCDIDLFTGVVAETPLRDKFANSSSTIGETLNHIQGNFFQRAKCGDRYWYEFSDSLFTNGKYYRLFNITTWQQDMLSLKINYLHFVNVVNKLYHWYLIRNGRLNK